MATNREAGKARRKYEQVLLDAGYTPEQVEEAVQVNESARLLALKIGLLVMAGLAMLAIIPAGRLPDYRPGDIEEVGQVDPPTS